MVMENMFGDILSDLAGGLVGGMGMAASAEIGDHHCHSSRRMAVSDIMGQDKANPPAAILSGAMMLDWLGHRSNEQMLTAAELIEDAVTTGFAARAPVMEFGGDMGLNQMTEALLEIVKG